MENNQKNQKTHYINANKSICTSTTARMLAAANPREHSLEMLKTSPHIYQSDEGGFFFYHISIIDYLQEYNARKKFEHWWRTNIAQASKALISCVPAELYASRFLNFMRDEVIIDDKNSEAQQSRNSSRASHRSQSGSIVFVNKTPSIVRNERMSPKI